MDELYAIAAVATVIAAVAGYFVESRRDGKHHDQVRDLWGYVMDHERRIATIEARDEDEDASEGEAD